MIRNTLLLLVAMLVITSCYTKHDHNKMAQPLNLIDRDTIVLILADIEIIEAALRQKQNLGHQIDDMRDTYYKSVFATYEISKQQYDSSMLFYRQDLEEINAIYEDVITRLSLIQSEVELE